MCRGQNGEDGILKQACEIEALRVDWAKTVVDVRRAVIDGEVDGGGSVWMEGARCSTAEHSSMAGYV